MGGDLKPIPPLVVTLKLVTNWLPILLHIRFFFFFFQYFGQCICYKLLQCIGTYETIHLGHIYGFFPRHQIPYFYFW